jgi:hypothetical protein
MLIVILYRVRLILMNLNEMFRSTYLLKIILHLPKLSHHIDWICLAGSFLNFRILESC